MYPMNFFVLQVEPDRDGSRLVDCDCLHAADGLPTVPFCPVAGLLDKMGVGSGREYLEQFHSAEHTALNSATVCNYSTEAKGWV